MFKKLAGLALTICVAFSSIYTVFALDNYVSAFIHDDGNTMVFSSYANKVGNLLDEAGIVLGPYDVVSPELSHEFGNFAEHHITITRGFKVTVQVDMNSEEIDVPKGMRIGFLIQRLREERGVDYIYEGSLNEELSPGQLVSFNVASTEHVVEYELLPYDTVQIMTDDLLEGRLEIANEGKEGIREIVYNVVSVNGNEISRTTISDTVSFMPESRVIYIGTGKLPEIEQAPIPETYSEGYSMESSENIEQPQPEQITVQSEEVEFIEIAQVAEIEEVVQAEVVQEEVFDPDAPPKQYVNRMMMRATAYTADYASTGKNPGHPLFGITASGMKAVYGVVAVDPNVIPLGTNLYIYGYGYCVAADTGSAIKGNRIDLYFNTAGECYRFGNKDIEVYILD